MATNPKWTRDEIVLAPDLYFRVSPLNHSENHPELVVLSDLLNKLPQDTQPDHGPNGFAECHHKKPVSELAPGTKTKLADLAIVCANCHRVPPVAQH